MLIMSNTSSVGAVTELFSSLERLQGTCNTITTDPGLKDVCVKAVNHAEKVVECLDYRTREYNCAKNDVGIMSGWLRQAVHRLVTVKKELAQYQEQKKFDNELKLADAGIDPRPIDISNSLSSLSSLSHSTSYESLKQQKKQSSSASGSGVRSATASPQPVFGIRKARSDPDINIHNMQKEVDAMKIDNKRLKNSEKKLLKETLQLGRKCRVLEDEKNRAEDRLMIEQTQRDSTEKLRQRNRELEQQVQKLKQQYQVINQKAEQEDEQV